jgi:hypothetical protein
MAGTRRATPRPFGAQAMPPGRSSAHSPALASSVRARLGVVALAGVVLAGLAIVLGTPARGSFMVPGGVQSFPGWLGGPLAGRAEPLRSSGYSLLFIAMALSYGGVLACARELRARWVIGAIAASHALFALAPPLFSGDVFGYLAYARLGALSGLDPYLVPPEAVPSDPVMAFVRWRYLPSPYGPLWTMLSYPLAPLGVAAGLWTLKALAAAASLALVALVWACARRLGRPAVPAAALVGLNPVLLVWGVGGGHNDLLVMAVAMAGVYLLIAGREASAAGAVIAAAALKASAGLALPFLLLGARRRGRALAGAAGGALLLALASLLVFGLDGLAGHLSVLERQAGFVSRHSVPNEIGKLLGLGGVTPSGLRVAVTPAIRVAAGALFLAVLAWQLRRAWRGGDWIQAAAWSVAALLATATFLLPWYLIWLLPLAALSARRGPAAAALALTAFMVVTRTPLLLA